jgi:hypothetical protein
MVTEAEKSRRSSGTVMSMCFEPYQSRDPRLGESDSRSDESDPRSDEWDSAAG